MTRTTHCKICKKEVDEGTRQNSIENFGIVVCSMECALKWMELEDAEMPEEWMR